MSDLIRRDDAIELLTKIVFDEPPYLDSETLCRMYAEEQINALPSAEAESDDLIIKGAKGIQDGLYNIKDGKLFKYKANGGTVRTYPIVPSADAEPTMTEEVREALMRLTMCAREECGICKYKDECGFDFQYKISTENMNTILDALYKESEVEE